MIRHQGLLVRKCCNYGKTIGAILTTVRKQGYCNLSQKGISTVKKTGLL